MMTLNQPQIVEGYIKHERVRPVAHSLRSSVFYLRIPIRSVLFTPPVQRKRWGNWIFGINRKSLISIHDEDHGSGGDLKTWLTQTLRDHQLEGVADGEIWLSCFPRVLGYQFKPVSFWFFENKEKELVAVFAEVHNTFGERHTYVLKPSENERTFQPGEIISTLKAFYVSPFFSIRGHYQFQFNFDYETRRDFARIDYLTDQMMLKTFMTGITKPLTSFLALKVLVKYPFMTLKIVAQIHLNALTLWLKKIPLTLSERNK